MTKEQKNNEKATEQPPPFQLERVDISHFRGLHNIALRKLGRVNLIAGKNSVGKSSVLDALILLYGADDPLIAHGINALRGQPFYTASAVETFGSLFSEHKIDSPIEIKGSAQEAWKSVRFTMPVAPITDHTIEPSVQNPFPMIGARVLRVEYSDSAGDRSAGELIVDQNGIHNRPGAYTAKRNREKQVLIMKSFLDSNNVTRFSRLDQAGKADELIPLLQIVEPRLKKLSIQVLQPAQPNLSKEAGLYADIGIGKQLPLAYCGDGLHRAVTAFCAIADCRGSMVLFDEIENGIHHGSMKSLWQAVFKLAQQYDTQIFATTHSWEAIKAAHAALNELDQGDQLRLYRLQREGTDIVVKSYEPKTLDAALESEIEVR